MPHTLMTLTSFAADVSKIDIQDPLMECTVHVSNMFLVQKTSQVVRLCLQAFPTLIDR
jgi:hypothetical protein